MNAIDLLQQTGLNKYEAEAYYALLAQGPLTGYELGKRSGVPLSRSYEILERLTQKGLALVQPGDPPRYAAEPADAFLARVRETMTTTLSALARELTDLPQPESRDEFWVVRGAENILARARGMIESAERSIEVSSSEAIRQRFAQVLDVAAAGGCRVTARVSTRNEKSPEILLLVDSQEALLGTIAPSPSSQVIVSRNRALLFCARGFFDTPAAARKQPTVSVDERKNITEPTWIDWETHKQRNLWRLVKGGRVA